MNSDGSTNSPLATMPPQVRCISQPIGWPAAAPGARQHHAVVECVQNRFSEIQRRRSTLVHDGDLPGRPAKADEPSFSQKPKGLGRGWAVGTGARLMVVQASVVMWCLQGSL